MANVEHWVGWQSWTGKRPKHLGQEKENTIIGRKFVVYNSSICMCVHVLHVKMLKKDRHVLVFFFRGGMLQQTN